MTQARFISILAGAAGGAICIAVMQLLSDVTHFPLMLIPFATSIVLVTGSPEAEPAQPRALVGGHLVATVAGLVVVKLAGPGIWTAAAAVGVAMIAMHLTRTFHPPAGIDPLVVVVNDVSWSFLLVPVALGALMLCAFALFWNNMFARARGEAWPRCWW